jgi:hypothetical protein
MYKVINKGAMMAENPMRTGWNGTFAATGLVDHTMKAIARPNNDTLYVTTIMDLRSEPVIVSYPVFDSTYVSLETSAYDHYVDIPLSTTRGDFQEPTSVLYYTERTRGYAGEPVEGVDTILEMTGNFVIAFLRVMPHAAEPERMRRNLAAIQVVNAQTLSEFVGEAPQPRDDPGFPAYDTDLGTFENNFLEVMQFVVNHTTVDPDDPLDQGVLAALAPLGVEPGKDYDPGSVADIDGSRFRQVAERVWIGEMARIGTPEAAEKYTIALFRPKGQISQDALLYQSVLGPIGLPASEAVYPAIATAGGEPMNAMHDYVIRMTADELPPATAFWSVTLYDTEYAFFLPNDRKKYSVGENAGMKLDENGGIAIYIAAEPPPGVPEENWLPLNRGKYGIDAIMRIYAPDLERFKTWTTPRAERLTGATDRGYRAAT